MATTGPDDYSWLFGDGSNYNPTDPGGPGGGSPDSGAPIDYNPVDPGGPGGGSPPGDPNAPSGPGTSVNWSQLLKALGYNSSSGAFNPLSLLALLAPLLTGITTSNASRSATNQLSDAAKAANAQIGGYITDAQGRYAPYVTGGQNAFNAAAAMPAIAPQFKPLGSGAALSALYNAGRK